MDIRQEIEHQKKLLESKKTDCNYCKHVSITEKEQYKNRNEPHRCKLTGNHLFHRGEHPKLPIPDNCPIKEKK